MKEITVTDGLGIIDIIHDGFITYAKFIRPATIIWGDYGGSIGEYLVIKDCSIEEREALLSSISEALNSGNKELIFNCIEPFLSLFANGTYQVEIEPSQPDYHIFYNSRLDSSNPILFEWTKKHAKTEKAEWCTEGFFCYDSAYIFTQPFEKIDPHRVLYYEEKIARGERPTVVILSVAYEFFYSTSVHSRKTHGFVIDGHHKLVAYQNQKIIPELVQIVRVGDFLKNTEDALEETKQLLFQGQIEHILKNRGAR